MRGGLELACAAGGCQGGERKCDGGEAGAEEYLPDGEVEVIVFGHDGLQIRANDSAPKKPATKAALAAR